MIPLDKHGFFVQLLLLPQSLLLPPLYHVVGLPARSFQLSAVKADCQSSSHRRTLPPTDLTRFPPLLADRDRRLGLTDSLPIHPLLYPSYASSVAFSLNFHFGLARPSISIGI